MMGFIWFWLVAVMIVGYVVLDGFDLGVGVLAHLSCPHRSGAPSYPASIGPVWDGNEVWLLAGGGTLYFAFPLLYASAFSGFYLPLMIVLWLLILRGVSLELRNHIDVGVWRALLDGLFGSPVFCLPSFSAPPSPTCCAAFPCKPMAISFCLYGLTGSPAPIPAFSTGTR
jgi:cytochrome d oxidase subunit CydB